MKNFKMLIFSMALMLSSQILAQPKINTIRVQGVSNISVNSTIATISATVRTKNESADLAISSNGELMQTIISALEGVEISGNNIQTTGFSFGPAYRWESNQRVFDGYSVNNNLQIKLDNIDNIGPIVDLVIESGATRINSVQFHAVNNETLKKMALIKASQNAKDKATTLAKASSVNLGKAVYITNITSYNDNISTGSVLGSPLPPGSVILPTSDSINAIVTIEYLIED